MQGKDKGHIKEGVAVASVLGKSGDRRDVVSNIQSSGSNGDKPEETKKKKGSDSNGKSDNKDSTGGSEATGSAAAGKLMGAKGGARQEP